MNTMKMIAEIKQTCGALEKEKKELMSRVKEIDDRLTGFRMAYESLEMAISAQKVAQPAEPEKKEPVERKTPAKRKRGVLYEYKGVKKTIGEWAKEYNMSQKTLYGRIHNLGYSMEDALTLGRYSTRRKNTANKVFAYDSYGNTVSQYPTVGAASKELKLPVETIKAIIKNMPKEDQLKARNYYLAYAT